MGGEICCHDSGREVVVLRKYNVAASIYCFEATAGRWGHSAKKIGCSPEQLPRRNDGEGALELRVNVHHRGVIVELSAVPRRAEDADQLAIREEAVAPLLHLVGPHDKVHINVI